MLVLQMNMITSAIEICCQKRRVEGKEKMEREDEKSSCILFELYIIADSILREWRVVGNSDGLDLGAYSAIGAKSRCM